MKHELTRRQESVKYLYSETFQNCLGEDRKKARDRRGSRDGGLVALVTSGVGRGA